MVYPALIASLPRICGGVSCLAVTGQYLLLSSPHMRGCFCCRHSMLSDNLVFPAYAGVFLTSGRLQIGSESLPRICGGVSMNTHTGKRYQESSPHMRGCFLQLLRRQSTDCVFPAYAGVFLPARFDSGLVYGLPRICGGVSCPRPVQA